MRIQLVSPKSQKGFPSAPEEPIEFLNDRQLCRKLGIGLTTLRRWRWECRELPPSFKLGRLVRYRRTEVEQWIERVVAGELKAGSRKPELV
jgi:predicted DNA-binding transcriptional regulator AlpA